MTDLLKILPTAETQTLRKAHIGDQCELFYRSNPVKAVRAEGQYLYDENGTQYLDCNSNVSHVGHCHPDVVAVGCKQMATICVNSRFLHDNIGLLAKEICDLLPEPLTVCYFTNSGSEANDLAIRLARCYTKRRHVAVLENAYHGSLEHLVELSTYKSNEIADWVHVVPLPDTYRGKYRDSSEEEASKKYSDEVYQTFHRSQSKIACFIVESIPSCAGQIIFPKGYLKEAFRHAKENGALCISDEVQTGLGRVGKHMWAFQLHDVVPDIVTIGKPIGNGHPLSVVVTTKEISASLKVEYFNTFAGNPVSCAIGLAVLHVVKNENLMQRAAQIGAYMEKCLNKLASRHAMIGQVRCAGLMIGVDLVVDRNTREPATEYAQHIIVKMKDKNILLNADGFYRNILKFKPPLCITKANVDHICNSLDEIMSEIENTKLLVSENPHLQNMRHKRQYSEVVFNEKIFNEVNRTGTSAKLIKI